MYFLCSNRLTTLPPFLPNYTAVPPLLCCWATRYYASLEKAKRERNSLNILTGGKGDRLLSVIAVRRPELPLGVPTTADPRSTKTTAIMVAGSALRFPVASPLTSQHPAPAFPSLPRAAVGSNAHPDTLPSAISLPFHRPLSRHPHPAGRHVRLLGRQLLVVRCQQLPNSTAVSKSSEETRDSNQPADTSSSDDDAGATLEAYGDATLLAAERDPDSLSVVPKTVREPVAGVDMEGSDFRVVSSSVDSRIDYLGESTKGDMKLPLTLPDDMGTRRDQAWGAAGGQCGREGKQGGLDERHLWVCCEGL